MLETDFQWFDDDSWTSNVDFSNLEKKNNHQRNQQTIVTQNEMILQLLKDQNEKNGQLLAKTQQINSMKRTIDMLNEKVSKMNDSTTSSTVTSKTTSTSFSEKKRMAVDQRSPVSAKFAQIRERSQPTEVPQKFIQNQIYRERWGIDFCLVWIMLKIWRASRASNYEY